MNDCVNHPALPRAAAARRERAEGGYVLLVLAMFFAVIAVGLMRVLPSALVETQREREEELIFRGQEYRRAIQAYVRKFGRYPNSIDDLENTNGVRFLRRRYRDPMKKQREEEDQSVAAQITAAWQRSDERAPEGEVEEWRLIHIGPGGTFPDAKTSFTPPTQNPLAPGGTGLPASAGTSRPGGASSENPLAGSSGFSAPAASGNPPGASGASTPASPFGGGSAPASQPSPFGSAPRGFGGGSAEGSTSPQSPFGQSSFPFGAQFPPGGSSGGIGSPPGVAGQPGAAPVPNVLRPSADPSANPAQQPRAAAAGQPGSGVFGGGGIAGVASHSTEQSIKVVNGYTQYDEWEFVYDFRADQIGMAAIARATGVGGQPVAAPGVPGQPGLPGVPGQPPPGVMTAQPPAPVPGGAPVPFPFPGSQAPGIRPGFPGAPGIPTPGTQPTPSPFDRRPSPAPGFQQPGFGQPGFGQPGFQQPGMQQPGFGQPGYQQPGFQQPGMQQPGFGQPGYQQPGFQQPGMQQPGFGQPGFQQPGARQPGFGQPGFQQPGFPPSPVPGFPQNPQQRR
jgi:type II secretory pathway pseudopilin PulG